jgi:hypothetical protein
MRHRCFWPDCPRQVPVKLLMCGQHWKTLPRAIRHRIWSTYRRGQEQDLRVSREYIGAVRAAQQWAREFEAGRAA